MCELYKSPIAHIVVGIHCSNGQKRTILILACVGSYLCLSSSFLSSLSTSDSSPSTSSSSLSLSPPPLEGAWVFEYWRRRLKHFRRGDHHHHYHYSHHPPSLHHHHHKHTPLFPPPKRYPLFLRPSITSVPPSCIVVDIAVGMVCQK